jgi:hypothetical protein
MSGIVTPEELKALTGYERPSDIEKCLRKNGVRFLYGKTGIYTTVDALNTAMGLKPGENNAQPNDEPDIL